MISFYKSPLPIILTILLTTSCTRNVKETITTKLDDQITAIDGDVALAFYDLSDSSNTIMIRANEEFHAASTMKVPVLIELYKQADLGRINLNDSILIKNEFRSIVDSSLYQLNASDDSDTTLYKKTGSKVALHELIYHMITASSNLATNLLIQLVDAKNVTASMREIGAEDIVVLRGVEDQKAYDLGRSNTTTAKDLMLIMKAIATHTAGTPEDCEEMITILKDQHFNDMIPRFLPKDVEVAHKTGSITGIHHDAGIVYLPDGRSYVLVLLSKNLKDFNQGTTQLAKISKTIYDYMISQQSERIEE